MSVAIAGDGKLMVVDYAGLVVVNPSTRSQSFMPWGAELVRPWGNTVLP